MLEQKKRVPLLKSYPEKADAERHTDIICPSTVHIHKFTRGRLCCPISVQVILTQLLPVIQTNNLTKNRKKNHILQQCMTNGSHMQVINLLFLLLSITGNYPFQLLYFCLFFLALLQWNFAAGVKGGRYMRKVVVRKE